MTAVNAMNLVIDDRARSYAKIYASLLKDEFQRKRAYASIVALYALINAVEKTDNDIQKTMTLFRNPALNEQYEISDVYINNWHVDVRVIVDGDAFLVPKSHYDNDLQPDFYAVIKVDKALSQAQLLGFCETSTATKEPFDYHYYSITLNSLISYDDFLTKVNNKKLTSFAEDEHEFFRTSYLSLLDEELDVSTKNRLLKHLFGCPLCRTEFCCFTGFEMVNCNIGNYPDLLDDQTLNVIGAQDVDKEKYAGKEETIYIGNDENQEQIETPSKQEEQEIEQSAEKIVEVAPKEEQQVEKQEKQEEKEEKEEKEEVPAEKIKNEQKEEAQSEKKEEVQAEEEEKFQDEQKEEPTDEAVSDILDELFNIDEEFVETEPVEEKTIVAPQPTISDSGDLEIIEDNSEIKIETPTVQEAPLEIIEDPTGFKPSGELEVINDGLNLTKEDESEVIIVGEESKNFEENDLEIHEDTDEELVILEDSASVVPDEIPSPDDNIQKVIVDYDEYGEPIYSYITNVGQETLEDTSTAIEPLEEDETILNEEFETYPQEIEEEDLSSINNGAVRPIEYVQNEDIQNIEEVSEESAENSSDEILLENEEQEEFEEYSENDANELPAQNSEFEEYKEDILENDEVEDLDSQDELTSENEEEYEEEATDDATEEEYDEESDAEYNEEYDEEYDEEEDEMPNEKVGKPAKSANLALTALLVLLLVIGGGAGAFFFMKKNAVEPAAPAPTDNNIEVPTGVAQIDDMFEAAENGGIEIPQTEDNAQNSQLPPPPNPADVKNETIDIPKLTEQDLLKPEHRPKDVSATLANAFSPNSNSVSLRAVNWLCSPQLFTDGTFKAYLQNLDNIVKLNLRKNILDATETPQNSTVTVKMAVENSGNLNRVAIAESSGSEQIDNIVLQSINESFEGEKSQILNGGAQKADMYYLKLVIKL